MRRKMHSTEKLQYRFYMRISRGKAKSTIGSMSYTDLIDIQGFLFKYF